MSDNVKFDARVEIDTQGLLRRYGSRAQAAQSFVDSEVVRLSDPYVPFLTGMLAKSAVIEEPGRVVYTAVYARRMYYGDGYNFTLTHHPLAGARWTERMKAAHMGEIREGAEKILRGGTA